MGKREQNRLERQERVVEAAVRAISELGYAEVRMSDIAERAAMTTGHVTYYFPSKTALLMLAIRQSEESLLVTAEAELAEISDPWDQLDRLIDLSIAREVGDSGWALWFHVWSEAVYDPDIAGIHHELDGRWRELLTQIITRGASAGRFRLGGLRGPEEASTILSSAMDGLSVQLSLGAPGVSAATVRELSMTLARRLLDWPG